ncbi:MAG: hypothetical protein JWO67_5882, partial [Streptosporangiaceae bacterium]|nr:hypothetical protein [Streptosporangiaceae bacterium]
MRDGGPVGAAIEGARADRAVSADAMRWSPRQPPSRGFPGVDCSTGLGDVLRPRVRRLVRPVAQVAAGMLGGLRRS